MQLSPLLFIIAMMSLNHTLRKSKAGYKRNRLQEKTNHQMYIDDIKLFAKNKMKWKLWYTQLKYTAMAYEWNLV